MRTHTYVSIWNRSMHLLLVWVSKACVSFLIEIDVCVCAHLLSKIKWSSRFVDLHCVHLNPINQTISKSVHVYVFMLWSLYGFLGRFLDPYVFMLDFWTTHTNLNLKSSSYKKSSFGESKNKGIEDYLIRPSEKTLVAGEDDRSLRDAKIVGNRLNHTNR